MKTPASSFLRFLACSLLLWTPATFAYKTPLKLPAREYPILDCFAVAASTYDIPAEYLWAIGSVESSLTSVVGPRNKNGTYDIGIMQINTSHLKYLQKFGVSRQRLLKEPCLNIHIGAWVLRGNIDAHGETWEAVGAYNASKRRPDLRLKYARKVRKKLAWLVEWRNKHTQAAGTPSQAAGTRSKRRRDANKRTG